MNGDIDLNYLSNGLLPKGTKQLPESIVFISEFP